MVVADADSAATAAEGHLWQGSCKRNVARGHVLGGSKPLGELVDVAHDEKVSG